MIPRSKLSPGTVRPQHFPSRDAAVNNPPPNFHHHD